MDDETLLTAAWCTYTRTFASRDSGAAHDFVHLDVILAPHDVRLFTDKLMTVWSERRTHTWTILLADQRTPSVLHGWLIKWRCETREETVVFRLNLLIMP